MGKVSTENTQPSTTVETPPAVVSSAPTATTTGGAVREAKARKTAKKNENRTTRSGGVRYVPGQSCIQLGKEHDFVRRTAKTGKMYDVCKKCGSSKMVRQEGETKASTIKSPKAGAPAQPERPANTDIQCVRCQTWNPYGTDFCSNCSNDLRKPREVCLAIFTNRQGQMVRCDLRYDHEQMGVTRHSHGGQD